MIFKGVPVCEPGVVVSVDVSGLALRAGSVEAGLVFLLGTSARLMFVFAASSPPDCLKTKYPAMPTSASSSNAMAMTPAVKIGFDRRASCWSERAESALK